MSAQPSFLDPAGPLKVLRDEQNGRYLWAADMLDAQPEAVRIMRAASGRARSIVEPIPPRCVRSTRR